MEFHELKLGAHFIDANNAKYIKTEVMHNDAGEIGNAVNLQTGRLMWFQDDDLVVKI